MAQRIKGQEVTLSFVGPTGDEDGLQDVVSFEAELDIEILEEGFLGETANRFDDIYNGTTGRMELQIENRDYFRFQQRVQDRAQRRTPAAGKFNAKASFRFPDGTRVRLTFEDIFFGPLPVRVPSRRDYVTATVQWKCTVIRRVF